MVVVEVKGHGKGVDEQAWHVHSKILVVSLGETFCTQEAGAHNLMTITLSRATNDCGISSVPNDNHAVR